jgi:ABC-type amino acid transport system permease subunit
MDAWAAVSVGLTLHASAYLGEIWRGSIEAVPRGQTEAARALGIPELFTWAEVVVPQALRMMIPAFIGVVTLIVKVSGLASAIGVAELVYQANILAGQSYRYFELFTAVGIFYFCLIFPLSLLAQRYERILAHRTR